MNECMCSEQMISRILQKKKRKTKQKTRKTINIM